MAEIDFDPNGEGPFSAHLPNRRSSLWSGNRNAPSGSILRSSHGRAVRRSIIGVVIRSLRLEAWAGQWVAVDGDGRVVADAESVRDLLRDLRDNGIEGVEIMRAPDPQQPATYGLG